MIPYLPFLPHYMASYWAHWMIVEQKLNLFKSDVFWTPLEAGPVCTSEAESTSLAVISCMCGSDCGNVSVYYYSMERRSARDLGF